LAYSGKVPLDFPLAAAFFCCHRGAMDRKYFVVDAPPTQ
jgi:hypothetical protein